MGIEVDPYIPRLPIGRWVDPNGRLTLETKKLLEYQNKVIHDLETSVFANEANITVNETNISNITVSESFETSSSSAQYHKLFFEAQQIEDRIPRTESKQWFSDATSSNRTLVDHEFYDGLSSATLTLDDKAGAGAQIITANGDGSPIKVTSLIQLRYKGQRGFTITMRNEGTTLHWHLFITSTEKYWKPR